jgi:predicted permease
MDNLVVIFGIIFLGVVCKRRGMFTQGQIEGFEIFLFKITTPCLLFYSTLTTKTAEILNFGYIFSYLLSFALVALFAFVLLFKKNNPSEICIKILASSYVSSAIYATPLIDLILKNPLAGVIGSLLQVIFIQTGFILLLSLFAKTTQSVGRRLLNVALNPLVFMPILGLVLNYAGAVDYLTYPLIIIKQLATMSSGLALFVFGLMLGGFALKSSIKSGEILTLVGIKTIAHPLIAVVVGKYIFGLEGYWLYALLIVKSGPTALGLYLIAKRYSVKAEVIKSVVSLSSIASLAPLFVIISFIYFN